MKSRTRILEERIEQIKLQQQHDFIALKEQLETTYESLNPVHVFSDLIENSFGNSKLKSTLLKTGLSSAASFLISKFLFKNSKSLLGNLTSTAIQTTTYKLVQNLLKSKTNIN